MGKFSKFEEIQAWQKAHDVTMKVYRITAEISRMTLALAQYLRSSDK